MLQKKLEKKRAILLRKRGYTYSEILKEVPAAKATLSLWLRSVGLAKMQKQRITKKRLEAAWRGAQRKKEIRLASVQKIKNTAAQEIKRISQRELWFMGIMLYWAEGSKEKEHHIGSGVRFSNSDPYMIRLFLKWISGILGVPSERVKFEIYLHENKKQHVRIIQKYWSEMTRYPLKCFGTVYFKKHKVKTNRKNIGREYYGALRVSIKASSSVNRKIAGWIEGINRYYWGVV